MPSISRAIDLASEWWLNVLLNTARMRRDFNPTSNQIETISKVSDQLRIFYTNRLSHPDAKVFDPEFGFTQGVGIVFNDVDWDEVVEMAWRLADNTVTPFYPKDCGIKILRRDDKWIVLVLNGPNQSWKIYEGEQTT